MEKKKETKMKDRKKEEKIQKLYGNLKTEAYFKQRLKLKYTKPISRYTPLRCCKFLLYEAFNFGQNNSNKFSFRIWNLFQVLLSIYHFRWMYNLVGYS